MNLRELETLVVHLRDRLDSMGDGDVHRLITVEQSVAALHTELNGLGLRVNSLTETVSALTAAKEDVMLLRTRYHDMSNAVASLHGKVEILSNDTARQHDHNESTAALLTQMGADFGAVNERVGAVAGQFEAAGALIEELRAKVEGRNKSAPTKRNMTDEDAMRVLKGDLAVMGHKDAAEKVGLTYAQVYSCRLGFTFKHVIHQLEKDGWRSPWAKG